MPAPVQRIRATVRRCPADRSSLALATRPGTIFATRAKAMARYLKVAGLAGLVDADAPEAEGGIVETSGGWTLA